MTIFYTISFCFFCFYLLYVFKETILPVITESKNKKAFQQYLYTQVGWIAERCNNLVAYKDSVALRDEELLYYIMQEEYNLQIPKDYYIDYSNETEKANVEEILELHKNDVIKTYFHGFLPMSKDTLKLTSLEYYLFSLCEYLEKNSNIYRDKLYKFESRDDTYSYYELTDFGRAYYKVYLIAATFRQSNEKIKKLYSHLIPDTVKNIMKYLEKNEIVFWN